MFVSFCTNQKVAAVAAALLATVPAAAHATVVATVSYSPNGLPGSVAGATQITLPAVGTYNSGIAEGAVTITTANGGAVVNGSVTDQYAAPVTGGTVAQPNYLTSNYLSTGGYPGTITLSFSSQEAYLGLLWGSIGTGDELSFYNTAVSTTVAEATITGTQAMNAPGYNSSFGAQGYNGSEYTLINLTGGTFNEVVLSQSGGPSFESGLYEYAANNVSVPEPSTLALLGSGLAALGFLHRRRKSI